MRKPIHDDSVFDKPLQPKNTWQILSWLIFEPILLHGYSNTLNRRQTMIILLKAFPYIMLISAIIYLLGCLIVVSFDIPLWFPCQYKASFIKRYSRIHGFEKYFWIVKTSFLSFYESVMLVLGAEIIEGLLLRLAGGIAAGVGFGIALGIIPGFLRGITGDFAFWIICAMSFGIADRLVCSELNTKLFLSSNLGKS